MLIALNSSLRRRRRGLALAAALLALSAALVAAHGTMSGHLPHDVGTSALVVCVAVVESAAALGVARLLARYVVVQRATITRVTSPGLPAPTPRLRPPRTQPQVLQVFLR